MNIKELKDEIAKFDDETDVVRAYGSMRINIPTSSLGTLQRYLTHDLIAVKDDDPNKKCVLVFVDL